MANNIFESARKLNELLQRESKYALVRNGRVIGFVDRLIKKKKAKKRRKK